MGFDLIAFLIDLKVSLLLGVWAALLTGYGFAIILLPRILIEQRSAGAAWAWLLLVFVAPPIGVVLYVLFGGRHLALVRMTCPDLVVPTVDGVEVPASYVSVAGHLAKVGGGPVMPARDLEFVCDGVRAFEALCDMIRGAQHSIELSVFILYRDEVGATLVGLLAKKAREGVAVRVLLDALGSAMALGSFTDPIREAGGRVERFLPLLPGRRPWSVNMRNHRKVVIVDDDRALVGGMNFGLEYMGPKPDPARWKDMILLLSGPAVAAVRTIFEEDWHIATGAHRVVATPAPITNPVAVQILGDGPAFYQDSFSRMVLAAARLARHHIRVITPYYVPDIALQKALITASHTGVIVELLIPRRSNHRSADWARRPFLRELIEEGVHVLVYEPGMVHGKCGVVDGRFAWVSSANLDMRSLTFNFEISAIVWDAVQAGHVEHWFAELSTDCSLLRAEELNQHKFSRVGEDVLRLLSPLM